MFVFPEWESILGYYGLVGLLGWILVKAHTSVSQGREQRTEIFRITCLPLNSVDSNTSNATMAEDREPQFGRETILLEDLNETSFCGAAFAGDAAVLSAEQTGRDLPAPTALTIKLCLQNRAVGSTDVGGSSVPARFSPGCI